MEVCRLNILEFLLPLSHAQGRHIISGDTLRLFMSAARLWTAFAKTRSAHHEILAIVTAK